MTQNQLLPSCRCLLQILHINPNFRMRADLQAVTSSTASNTVAAVAATTGKCRCNWNFSQSGHHPLNTV